MFLIRLYASLFRFGITLICLGALAQMTMDLCTASAKLQKRGIFSLSAWNKKLHEGHK